ncbi:MAG: cell division protein FtsA [Acidobacteria bacterium]|nr:cell division protein FtsA [Acidobacteriota bacterium]
MGSHLHAILTAIDAGCAKTCVVVAEAAETGLRYRSHGLAESHGSRKGVIVDLEQAAASVRHAVEMAERAGAVNLESAFLGTAGAHIRGVNSQGGIFLGAYAREVQRADVRAAAERARTITLPAGREVLHLLPQQYIVDEQPGIQDPEGMVASRLEVKVHMVTALASAVQNAVTVVNRAGLEVEDKIFEPLAAADAVLRAEERELGTCLIDVGAGSTDLIVLHHGAVVHSGSIPVGGDHFTYDIAMGLQTPAVEAEKLKRMFGCAIVVRVPSCNEVEIPSPCDRPSRLVPQRMLAEILEPRARELFDLVARHLRMAGLLDLCAAGAVLCGGGARLVSIREVAEDALRCPVRLGYPVPLPGMPAALCEPEFACALGMLYYGARARAARGARPPALRERIRSLLAFTSQ